MWDGEDEPTWMSETDLADVHADIDCWIDEAKADFIADMRVDPDAGVSTPDDAPAVREPTTLGSRESVTKPNAVCHSTWALSRPQPTRRRRFARSPAQASPAQPSVRHVCFLERTIAWQSPAWQGANVEAT